MSRPTRPKPLPPLPPPLPRPSLTLYFLPTLTPTCPNQRSPSLKSGTLPPRNNLPSGSGAIRPQSTFSWYELSPTSTVNPILPLLLALLCLTPSHPGCREALDCRLDCPHPLQGNCVTTPWDHSGPRGSSLLKSLTNLIRPRHVRSGQIRVSS